MSKTMKGKGKNIRRFGAAVVAMVLVVAMLIGLMPGSNVALAADYTTDQSTVAKYTESLGDNTSTEYAGRVWTDKSVFSGDAVFTGYGGETVTVEKGDEDFLVSFSALATSQSIAGQTQAPIDVVFIIDLSGSMSNADSNMTNSAGQTYSRIKFTVDAVNKAISDLMESNPYTRVGVVGFSSEATTLLELDRYTKNQNSQYFTLNRTTGSSQYATLTTNAINSAGQRVTGSTSVSGGTNIQYGLYRGMGLLANASTTTAMIDGQEIKRVPSVILLSDGSPTFSCEDTKWYAPTITEAGWFDRDNDDDGYIDGNGIQGPGSGSYYGNGMLAVMTGAYMKAQIDAKYGVAGTSQQTTVYTIGMGINDLVETDRWGNITSTADRDLARVTLNPKVYLDTNNEDYDANNTFATSVSNAWEQYCNKTNNTPNIQVDSNSNYSLTHPASGDISGDAIKKYADLHYDADSADSIGEIFENIVNNITISTPQIPTEHDPENPAFTGYITYKDPIGEYMEVKDMKAIVYAGQTYTAHTVSADGKTYTFTDMAPGNEVYGEAPLSEIIITVDTETVNGVETEVLTVQIPAALIPLRVNTIELDSNGAVISHTNNGTYPIRILYTVGLQEGLVTDGNVNMDMISEEYLEKHPIVNGKVQFFSNLYTGRNVINGHTAGDATVSFDAAHTNPFYYMQNDYILHTDPECTQRATVIEDREDVFYYYNEVYYHGNEREVKVTTRSGASLNRNVTLIHHEDGYWYRPAGSVRTNNMLEFEGLKLDASGNATNLTGTAESFYAPTYAGDEGQFVVYLGNNGVVALDATGELKITKEVLATEGLTAPEKEFTFTVNFNGDAALAGAYPYTITENGAEVTAGEIIDGGTIKLKDSQEAVITELPKETTYTVTEAAVDGFTANVGRRETNVASGTIAAGETATADFTNFYAVEPKVVTEFAAGFKTLVGREWKDTDRFVFVLTADNPAITPMPAVSEVTVTKADLAGDKALFDFGDVVYETPGTYTYTIDERVFELVGFRYSAAQYSVIVTVTDNGDGTLNAETEMYMKVGHAGEQLFDAQNPNGIPVGQGEAEFINTYNAKEAAYGQVVHKNFIDRTQGSHSLTNGMFRFKLEALGDAPMPEGVEGNVMYADNVGDTAIFDQIVYTQDMAGKSFEYRITEVIPEDAVRNEDGTYYYKGMTYDGQVHSTRIDVSLDDSSGEALVRIDVYYDGELTNQEGQVDWFVTFNNEYQPEPVEVEFTGIKTLTGRDMLDGEEFEFALTPANAPTYAAVRNRAILVGNMNTTVSGGTDGDAEAFAFDGVIFTRPGTYVFDITETTGTANGVTYDSHVSTVTVTVTDADGVLEADVVYSDGNEAEFENIYTPTFDPNTAITLGGTKELTGRELKAGQFFFAVESPDGTSYVSANADGAITFLEKVTYDETGTYVYRISEVEPKDEQGNKVDNGVTYDKSVYEVTVTVVDDYEAGTIKAAITKIVKTENNQSTEVTEQEVTFENVYEPDDVELEFRGAQKVLSGERKDALKAGEFEFVRTGYRVEGNSTATDGMVFYQVDDPATKDVDESKAEVGITGEDKVQNDANGFVSFGKIKFTKPGTYIVEVKEIIPEDSAKVSGVTYDGHILRGTFEVTDNLEGKLVINLTGVSGSQIFRNQYNTTGTLIGADNLNVTKVFDVTTRTPNTWTENDVFSFTLEAGDDTTVQAIADGKIVLPEDTTIEIDVDSNDSRADQNAADSIYVKEKAFDDIVFHAVGNYVFNLREVAGSDIGMNYDATVRKINVVTTDNGDGTLQVTLGTGSQTNPTFRNIYNVDEAVLPGHENLHVDKVFTGRPNDEWLATDAFTFTLEAVGETLEATKGDNPLVVLTDTEVVVTRDNKDVAHFGNITFRKEGTYEFAIKEVVPEKKIPGVSYDADLDRKVIVVVTEEVVDGDNFLVAAIDSANSEGAVKEINGEEIFSFTFTNTYSTVENKLAGTELEVTKELTGRDWNENDAFTFTLEAGDANTARAMENDIVRFANGQDTMSVTVDASKKAHFEDITFTTPGTYVFTIAETAEDIKGVKYDEHMTSVVVTVVDNGDGTLGVSKTIAGSMTWTNTYTPDVIRTNLEGVKTIKGRQMTENDTFRFTITANNEIAKSAMPANTTVVNDGNAISFGPLSFSKAGTYQYAIAEQLVNSKGITSDIGFVRATVKVEYDSKAGALYIAEGYPAYEKVNSNGNGFEFINDYSAYGSLRGQTNLKVTKNLTGRANDAWLEGDSFTFKLAAVGETLEATKGENPVVTLPNNASGITISYADALKEKAFGDIRFTKAGEYEFVVTEVTPEGGSKDGITYDGEPQRTILVNVTDNGDGTLTAAVVADESESLTYNNSYDTVQTTLAGFTVEKMIVGREWINQDAYQFTFAVDENDTSTVEALAAGTLVMPSDELCQVEITNGTEGHKATFGDVIFKELGTYKFVINEVIPAEGKVPGVTYDSQTKHITVVVEDNNDGTMTAAATIEDQEDLVFENTYKAGTTSVELEGLKKMEGRELKDTDKFEFTISAAEGTPMPAETTVVNAGDGTIAFAPIVYDEAGTYTYEIKETGGNLPGVENADNTVEVTVTVTDNKQTGKLEATVVYGEGGFVFVNHYSAEGLLDGTTHLKVTKNFAGRENDAWIQGDEFTFTLAAVGETLEATKGENPVVTLPDNASGITISYADALKEKAFGSIKFTEVGEYEFVVTEVAPEGGYKDGITYDSAQERTIRVNVADNGDGTLTATVIAEGSESLTYNNNYDTRQTTLAGLTVEKRIVGREWIDKDVYNFTFAADQTHTPTAQALTAGTLVMPSAELCQVEITNGTEGHKAAFGNVTFNEPGTYKFVINEVIPEDGKIPGVTYDSDAKHVTVVVTDNNDGTMTAVATVDNQDDLVFENTYKAASVSVELEGTKKMTGRELKDTDEFGFTISAAEGTPMPAEATVVNEDDGTITFAPIVYDEVGTYTYEIKETSGNVPGVTNAVNTVKVTVTVTDNNQTGKLEATTKYSEGGFVFTNTYKAAPTEVSLQATKVVTASEGNSYTMKGNEFKFQIDPAQANPASDPVEQGFLYNSVEGVIVVIDKAKYTESGIYEYTVHEVSSESAGMTLDSSVYKVVVEVTDNEATGKLEATTTFTKKGVAVSNDEFVFDNQYAPEQTSVLLEGQKKLVSEHKDGLEAGLFTFKVEAVSGKEMAEGEEVDVAVDAIPMPQEATALNESTGLFKFNEITYTKPGTYVYQIKEVIPVNAQLNENGQYTLNGVIYDTSVHTVTVVVKDVEGGLQAEVTGLAEVEFTNGYIPKEITLEGDTAIKGTKKLTGRDLAEGEFEFKLAASNDKTPMPEKATVANAADGSFSFEPITFRKAGTYYYTITETNGSLGGVTYDDTAYTVKVVVTDMGGYLAADVTIDKEAVVFENTYKAQPISYALTAEKTLSGRVLEDGEFEFTVSAEEGTPMPEVTTVKNTDGGNVAFEAVEYDTAGEYVYTIAESAGEKGGVVYDTNTFEVTVSVTDDYKGNLHAEVTSVVKETAEGTEDVEDKVVVFENAYAPANTSITLTGKKTLVGRELLEGEFTFLLKNSDGEVIGRTTNAADGSITFEALPFTQVGRFEYTVVEDSSAQAEGIIYDKASYKIVVKVTDNLEGQLVAEVIEQEEIIFNNKYTEPNVTAVKLQAINDGEATDKAQIVTAGDKITYIIRLTNTGDAAARNIVLTDKVPEGLELVAGSAKGTDVIQIDANGIITWHIARLEAGKYVEVSFQVEVPEVEKDTTWTNVAEYVYDNNPENPDEPEKTNEVEVTEYVPKLEIEKKQRVNIGFATTDKKTVKEGDKVVYYITVSNVGNGDVKDVVVTDMIPAGLVLIDDSISDNGVNENGKITWNIDMIKAGEKVTLEFAVRVPEVTKDTTWKNIASLVHDGNAVPSNEVVVEIDYVEIPVTGDTTTMTMWFALALASAATAVGTVVTKRRRAR